MMQRISYQLRFGVPAELGERECMLASIDSVLGVFEGIDRLIANSIGMELIYKRVLREMGTAYFDYEVTLTLVWPVQLQLGSSPEPASISLVVDRIHQDLLKSLKLDSANANEIISNWDEWARKEGLADSLFYTTPSAERLQPFLDDFRRATHNLNDRIVLS